MRCRFAANPRVAKRKCIGEVNRGERIERLKNPRLDPFWSRTHGQISLTVKIDPAIINLLVILRASTRVRMHV